MNFRMIAVAFVCALALGCGGDVEKKGGNNANNANNANNGNNQNNIRINNANNVNNVPVCADNEALASINGGAARCYAQCVAGSCSGELTCFEGICIDEAQTTNNINNVNNGGSVCETNADCRSDQRCRQGTCQDHMYCDYTNDRGDCGWEWTDCEDGKEYAIQCDGGCVCSVNGTAVSEFFNEDVEVSVCNFEPDYRAINEGCDWLVPAPF